MAGIGAAPKDPSERHPRAKTPQRGEWIDINAPEIETPVLPEKPPHKRKMVPWRQQALKIWAAWRLDPVTAFWSKSDITFALATLELYDLPGPQWTKNAAEIRQRETALALNPKGKRDLRYRITFGPGKEATKERSVGDANVISMDARRNQLGHGA